MRRNLICLPLVLCSLASAQEPKLRGGNILSSETYSYRDLIRAGKLDMLSVPAFYKEQGIPGISYNDMFFKTVDDGFIDEVKAAVKREGRIVTCYVIEGNLATADEKPAHGASGGRQAKDAGRCQAGRAGGPDQRGGHGVGKYR